MKKYLTSKATVYTHYLKRIYGKGQKISNPSNLVFIKNNIVNNQRRQKLEIK